MQVLADGNAGTGVAWQRSWELPGDPRRAGKGVVLRASYSAATSGQACFVPVSERALFLDVWSLASDVSTGKADWPALASKLSELLHGEPITVFVVDARSEMVTLLASSMAKLPHVPKRFLKAARGHCRRLKARVPSFRPVGGTQGVSRSVDVDDLAMWQESLEPDSAVVAAHLLETGQTTYLCVACGPEEPADDVSPECGKFVEVAARLLAQAVDCARRAETTSAQLHAASQILDSSAVGIIQLDRNGAVVELNAAALHISQFGDGVTITTAGVHATTEADEAVLQKAIADAIANKGGDYVSRFSIRRRNGLPTSVVLASIDRAQLAGADQTCCVLYVVDSEAPRELDPSAIVDLLRLTPAQARVVAALADGTPLAEVATRLGITINTVRTLLSRAMSKTGTNSQVALVRLVLTALIPLPSTR